MNSLIVVCLFVFTTSFPESAQTSSANIPFLQNVFKIELREYNYPSDTVFPERRGQAMLRRQRMPVYATR